MLKLCTGYFHFLLSDEGGGVGFDIPRAYVKKTSLLLVLPCSFICYYK